MKNASLFFAVIGVMFFVLLSAIYAQPLQPQGSALSLEKNYRLPLQEDNRPAIFSSSYLESPALPSVYENNPTDKMSFGVINTVTSWINVPKAVTTTTEKHNVLVGGTVGLGVGIIQGINQAVLGVVDIATFGFPPYDEPSLKPQYEVENPDKGLQIDILKW